MSEVEVRMTLVGPAGRSLKFLNNKNNLANLYLHKQMSQFERERSFNISRAEQERLEAADHLKTIRRKDVDSLANKKLLEAWEFSPPETPTLRTGPRKKKRLTQTAPANMQQSAHSRQPKEVTQSVEPEPAQKQQQQPSELPNMGRKQSMYLHLPAQGKQTSDEDTGLRGSKFPRKSLPKPNPKTLLDVMMGLNAFSHVPPPRCKSTELVRSDSRQSAGSRLSSRRDSLDDSQENAADSFMKHWKRTIAQRRQSIVDKLAAAQRPFSESRLGNRPVSTLESVPETGSQPWTRRSKSKWNIHQNMITPSLPVISQDDDERTETFQAWMEEKKDEIKSNKTNPAYVNPALDRVKERRKSFMHWLDKRGNPHNNDAASDDDVQEVREPEIRARPPPPTREGKEKIDIGQMLGTIMQIKTRFRDPVDKRLKRFYRKLDDIKARDDEAKIGPRTEKEKRRRWKMLMKGIDAALADSSDEEDDYIHTV